MVWGLFPVDSLRGAQKYYIFSEGTYKVGRKDCDIVVQMDTAVSRLHSEIVVDKMTSRDPCHSGSTSSPSYVCVRDRSKYGTFVNKELGTKALRLHTGQEATLTDGDSVTFGTGNATFRLCCVPLIIFSHCSKPTRANTSVQETIASIGAYATCKWSSECTHVLVDESSPVTLDLIEAVVVKKPIILIDWLKVLAEKNIRTEFPSCTSYVPTLSFGGTFVKIVEPNVREKCLKGYSFVLGSLLKYKFGDKFQSLLEVVKAKFLHANEFRSSSQTSADGENTHYVLVIPGKSENEFDDISELSSLSRVTDMKLVAAILSGHLESSIIEPPSIVVSSSHSTDETTVADSDVEMDTVTSNHIAATNKFEDAVKYKYEDKDAKESGDKKDTKEYEESKNGDNCKITSGHKINSPGPRDADATAAVKRLDKGDGSVADRHENSDIVFCQDLIVRNTSRPVPVRSTPQNIINFKCFRKREILSGNSFLNLIPFSKDPYKESDGGSNELSEFYREEKKQKQLEAIAEDLFNNEKGKKRASKANTLHAFLNRR